MGGLELEVLAEIVALLVAKHLTVTFTCSFLVRQFRGKSTRLGKG